MELCAVTRDQPSAAATADEGVMLLDGDGRCTYLSPTAASLLNRQLEAIQGAYLPELLKHGSKSNVMQALRQGGRLLYRSPQGNGTTMPIEIRFHPVANDNGAERYIGVVRNLDAVEQMEQDLKDQLCRERLFKECISHHFFNPLCIAQGYLHLVLNEESNGDEKFMLEAAKKALTRIETVVKNVIYDGDLRE